MKVGDGLAAIRAVVDDEPEAGVRNALATGDVGCGEEQVADQRLLRGVGFRDAKDGLTRHDQDVNRSLWSDVTEGDALLVLVNDVRRDFLVTDFLEQRLISHEDQTWHFAGSPASPAVRKQGIHRMTVL